NPLTTGGKLLDVALELYAMVVITSVAGAFASFFHRRTHERAARQDATPSPADHHPEHDTRATCRT
ncbi:MAG TPA: hypothetical protein VLJ59_00800, partial [Mycobacteriales bacterium]|nr:hypothetical protein [Mycobacteriales bacterium]